MATGFGQVKVEDLRPGVYASVGAATPCNVHLCPEDAGQALLEEILDGVPARLRLPPVEVGAVIRDRRSEARRSGGAIRSGAIRSGGLVRQPFGTACAVSHQRPRLRMIIACWVAESADGGG